MQFPPLPPGAGEPGRHRPHGGLEESLFPRELTTDLVARAEDPRARSLAQRIALGAGLAALALGLPSARLWAGGDFVGALERGGAIALAPLCLLHRLLDGALRSETAGYVLSALALGLSFLLLVRLLRRIGFEQGPSLLAAGLVCLSPVAWMGSILPLAVTPGLVGAALVVAGGFRVERDRRASRPGLALLLLLAWSLQPENALLAPAAGLAAGGAARRWMPLLGALLLALAGAQGQLVLPDPTQAAGRLGLALPGIGVGLLGLGSLLVGGRADQESPPPRWLLAVAGAGLAGPLIGPLAAGPHAAPWLVLGAIGLADALQRQQDGASLRGAALLVLLLQAVATGSADRVWRAGDPLATWRSGARRLLEPTDLALTVAPAHRHLLSRRFGLEVHDAGAPLDELTALATRAWSAGRRVVLVLPPDGQAPPAEGLPGVLVLGPDGAWR